MYLLQRIQGLNVYFSDEVGFCYSIKILSDGVNVHQAVVCDLNTLEVREKPANDRNRCCIYGNVMMKEKYKLYIYLHLDEFANFKVHFIRRSIQVTGFVWVLKVLETA